MPAWLLRIWPYLALAAGVVAVLTVAYCSGRNAGKTGEVNKSLTREIETQHDLGAAAANASDARTTDAVKAAQQQQELSDALNATQDPNRQRALRGCAIMRQQGRDTSRIPACR